MYQLYLARPGSVRTGVPTEHCVLYTTSKSRLGIAMTEAIKESSTLRTLSFGANHQAQHRWWGVDTPPDVVVAFGDAIKQNTALRRYVFCIPDDIGIALADAIEENNTLRAFERR